MTAHRVSCDGPSHPTPRTCVTCGAELKRRDNEQPNQFARRQSCGRACAKPGPRPGEWRTPTIDRIVRRCVEDDNGCWVWQGVTVNGYGKTQWRPEGGSRYVHRAMYELMRADIPEGLVLDHLCRNTLCCNPWHLEPVTNRVNVLRGRNVLVLQYHTGYCARGHDQSVHRRLRGGGGGYCGECGRLRNIARRLGVTVEAVA